MVEVFLFAFSKEPCNLFSTPQVLAPQLAVLRLAGGVRDAVTHPQGRVLNPHRQRLAHADPAVQASALMPQS